MLFRSPNPPNPLYQLEPSSLSSSELPNLILNNLSNKNRRKHPKAIKKAPVSELTNLVIPDFSTKKGIRNKQKTIKFIKFPFLNRIRLKRKNNMILNLYLLYF